VINNELSDKAKMGKAAINLTKPELCNDGKTNTTHKKAVAICINIDNNAQKM